MVEDLPEGWTDISIHALREEGDYLVLWTPSSSMDFYPRPPRGGRRALLFCMPSQIRFLSTPSARRATYYNTRCCRKQGFLSTPSARRATREPDELPGGFFISIHALREEGDPCLRCKCWMQCYFYPRPPRGGRQQKQRENPLLLSHYTPLCTNCKEVPVKQTAKSHRYLRKRLVFRCEASGKTMCAARSHWPSIKRSAHYPAQTPGAAQRARL